MLYIGCPIWANPAWKHSIYQQDAKTSDYLAQYAQFFNCVEGNTTFYADPSTNTLERWLKDTPDDYRFVLKVPKRISHHINENHISELKNWLIHLSILKPKLALVHLQLSAQSGPMHFAYISQLVQTISEYFACALEVRHPAFFDKADNEIKLHRMLMQFHAERVVIDSRALFSVHATTPELIAAQAKKPRVAVHAISLSPTPMLRFIGVDDMMVNKKHYEPWLKKVKQWLDEGKSPFCFFHTPDNHLAPELCRQFVTDLGVSHPCQLAWPSEQQLTLL